MMSAYQPAVYREQSSCTLPVHVPCVKQGLFPNVARFLRWNKGVSGDDDRYDILISLPLNQGERSATEGSEANIECLLITPFKYQMSVHFPKGGLRMHLMLGKTTLSRARHVVSRKQPKIFVHPYFHAPRKRFDSNFERSEPSPFSLPPGERQEMRSSSIMLQGKLQVRGLHAWFGFAND